MVRATLKDWKTNTRRLRDLEQINQDRDTWRYDGVNVNGYHQFYDVHKAISGHDPRYCILFVKCPYGKPGDRLWVRETWRTVERESDGLDGVLYRADGQFREIENTREAAEKWMAAYANGKWGDAWRPSILMPRWASRITLKVTGIRAERLQSITEEDAIAEGLECTGGGRYWMGGKHPVKGTPKVFGLAAQAFASIWDEINGEKAAWDSNPWVWVIRFAREVSQ
jgi:hypothetical protein